MPGTNRTAYLGLNLNSDAVENRNWELIDARLMDLAARLVAAVIGPAFIQQSQLAKPSVGTPELFDGAVTTAKLALGAVTMATLDVNVARQLLPPWSVPPNMGMTLVVQPDNSVQWAVPQATASGPAGGDLMGSYPNPQIAALAVKTGALADGAVARVKLSTVDVLPSLPPLPTVGVANEIVTVNPTGTGLIYAPTPPASLTPGQVSTLYLADAPNGVTTGKISDLAVTDAKIVSLSYSKLTGAPTIPTTLPPTGPAGGVLNGTYPNPGLATGSVVDANIVTLSYSKLTGAPAIPTTLPPSGPAGGSLTGTYPSPTIAGSAISYAMLGAPLALNIPTLPPQLPQDVGKISTVNAGGQAVWATPPWIVSGATVTPTDATKQVAVPGPTGAVDQAQLVFGTRTTKGRLGSLPGVDWLGLTYNRWFDGTNWHADDTSQPTWQLLMGGGDGLAVWRSTGTALNPTAPLLSLDNTGALSVPAQVMVSSGSTSTRLQNNTTLLNNAYYSGGWHQDDPSKPGWMYGANAANDNFTIWRSPPGASMATLMTLDNGGRVQAKGFSGGLYIAGGNSFPTGTTQQVPYNTTWWDTTGSMAQPSNNYLCAPSWGGICVLSAHLSVSGNGSLGVFVNIELWTGSAWQQIASVWSQSQTQHFVVTRLYPASGSMVFRVTLTNGTGATITNVSGEFTIQTVWGT